MEKDYLTGHWTRTKVLLGLLVPVSLAALALAFWRRSLLYGLVVLDSIVLAKIAWSFYYGGESGLALLPPALVGLITCSAAILYVAYRVCRKYRFNATDWQPAIISSIRP